ncbi:MAG: SH3 domain-containing protein [bacterium]|nr:SH3 domain-containing protein [bacterium]
MKKFYPVIFVMITILSSCNKTNENIPVTEFEKSSHLSWIQNLRIRNKPELKSTVLGMLKKGEEINLIDDKESRNMGTIEKFSEITLNGKKIIAPWVKIQTKNKKIGWVFGGGLSEITYFEKYKIFGVKNILKIYDIEKKKIIVRDTVNTKVADQDYKYINSIYVQREGSYLIIQPLPWLDPVSFYIGIFDTASNKWAGKIHGFNGYIGISPSKEYIYADNGTGSTYRKSIIYSIKEKKSVYECYPNFSSQWNKDSSIDFKIPLFNIHKKYDRKNAQVRNVTWKGGQIIKKGKIERAVFE